MTPLQIELAGLLDLAGLSTLALVTAAVAAAGYRWYFRARIPAGLAALFGVGAVAVKLQMEDLLGAVIGTAPPATDPFATATVVTNVLTLLAAFAVTPAGARLGEAAVGNLFVVSGAHSLHAEVGTLGRAIGRVTTVDLPDAADIEDMENYDPVSEEVKIRLGDTTLVFPGRRSVEELRERLVGRLKEDYGVNHVDVELDADGAVRYLALGSRVAGIGPTLGPGTAAVAVEADPAHSASPGDVVQLWTTGDDPRHVCTAELRATAGDVVTVATDEADVNVLDGERTYRLVTLPATARTDREFATLLRAADETLGVARVAAGSPLVGMGVADLDATVVAIRSADGSLDTLPDRSRTLDGNEDVYAVGRPETLRRLESLATASPEK